MENLNLRKNIIVVTIILSIVLYVVLKENFLLVLEQLISINIMWLMVAVFLMLLYWFMLSLSLCTLIREFKSDFKIFSSFRLILITQFFNGVTPFSSGGQPFQILMLRKEDIKTANATNIIIQNFIVYQFSLILLGTIAILINYYFAIFEKVEILRNLVILGHGINTSIMLILFAVSRNSKFNKFFGTFTINFLSKIKVIKDPSKVEIKWNEFVENFTDGAFLLRKKKVVFLKTLIYNIFGLLIFYMVPIVLLYSMGEYTAISIITVMISSAYVMLIGSFIPIPGGSGGLEFGFMMFFGQFILQPLLGTVMLLWRFITYYLGLFIGSIALSSYGNRGVEE